MTDTFLIYGQYWGKNHNISDKYFIKQYPKMKAEPETARDWDGEILLVKNIFEASYCGQISFSVASGNVFSNYIWLEDGSFSVWNVLAKGNIDYYIAGSLSFGLDDAMDEFFLLIHLQGYEIGELLNEVNREFWNNKFNLAA